MIDSKNLEDFAYKVQDWFANSEKELRIRFSLKNASYKEQRLIKELLGEW